VEDGRVTDPFAHPGPKREKAGLFYCRLGGEVLAGLLAGGIGAFVATMAGFVWPLPHKHPPEDLINWLAVSIPTGFTLSSPVGVWVVNRLCNQRVSFYATFGPGLIMAGCLIAAAAVTNVVNSRATVWSVLVFVLLGPPVSMAGAIVAAARTRRPI